MTYAGQGEFQHVSSDFGLLCDELVVGGVEPLSGDQGIGQANRLADFVPVGGVAENDPPGRCIDLDLVRPVHFNPATHHAHHPFSLYRELINRHNCLNIQDTNLTQSSGKTPQSTRLLTANIVYSLVHHENCSNHAAPLSPAVARRARAFSFCSIQSPVGQQSYSKHSAIFAPPRLVRGMSPNRGRAI